ncbi:hypothetical protein AVEN_66134-1 [Araneus ventricosus]|uniref:Histone-lysine N-methyltransferase SETMAR n=1 Tax=Araneus ventricosus TaxID=182803 RepID=A0A4Y2HI77_ARAVE|nr:hypothetical protein AVEN_66134-1 [Araneus ventricosus]
MINAAVSCQNLRRLPRAILTSGAALSHDNARLNCAVVTQQLLEQFKWDVSDHPAYSYDISTSNFPLFFEFRNWLGGQSFQKNKEIQSSVKDHLTLLTKTFLETGIESLVHRHDKYLIFTAITTKNNHV